MWRFIIGGIAGVVIYLITKEKKNPTDMTNTHNQFLQFAQNISVTGSKTKKLIASRKALQERIIAHFKTKPGVLVPKFYIQGSYKMKTMVLKKDGTYDVDLGVYFLTKPAIEPKTLQKWVFEAVNGHTSSTPEHKKKCIRVIYKGDFDIDLPVYYKTSSDLSPYLATKEKWEESDPKELCDWFNMKKDRAGQMLRLIKYFKIWANTRSGKMPSGIAFTVWVANNFKANERDDIAFYETATAIQNSLYWGISCTNPATPGDDLTSKLDANQKNNFKYALASLVQDAYQAIYQQNDVTKACNVWRKQLGDKFPLV